MNTTPPVGPATVAGFTATLTAAAAAVLAYLFADADEQTLGTIAAGVVAVVSLLATQAGRYAQAAKAPTVDPAADVLRDPADDGTDPEERDLHENELS